MRIGLDHVHIFATDIAATIAFFRTMFDATPVWDEDAAGVRTVRLRIGDAFIHVYEQSPKAPRGPNFSFGKNLLYFVHWLSSTSPG